MQKGGYSSTPEATAYPVAADKPTPFFTQRSLLRSLNPGISKLFLKPLNLFFQSNLMETPILKQIKSRTALAEKEMGKFYFLSLFPLPNLTPIFCEVALQNPETLV